MLVTLPNHLFCNASLLQAVSRTLPRTHPVGSVVLKEPREFAMSNIIIRPINPEDRAWIIQFIAEHWGAEIVVSRGVVYHPQDLPGFVAIQEGKKVGLVTYNIEGESCEVVTIDSIRPSSGVGTALIEAVRDIAIKSRCKRLWLITTNDNLNALRFYQKRGLVLVAVHRNALDVSRKLKPEIPLIGDDGIPLRDEIELEMMLDNMAKARFNGEEESLTG